MMSLLCENTQVNRKIDRSQFKLEVSRRVMIIVNFHNAGVVAGVVGVGMI